MSISSNMFGAPVEKYLIDQIRNRGNIFSKEGKTSEELSYIHSNAPWILVRSGVDSPKNGGSATPDLARNRVLMGGYLYNNQYGAGVGMGNERGNQFAYSPTGKVEGRIDMGFRPAPGITGLSVSTSGNSGIALATINLKVWSADDLDEINTVYFRPGFSILVEWGHTLWIDKSSKVQRLSGRKIPDSAWFSPSSLEAFQENIWGTMNNNGDMEGGLIREADGNYCGLIGYINNFSYDFDGKGYNCTIKMQGGTAITKFLQISSDINVTNSEDQSNQNTQNEDKIDNNAVVTILNNLSKPLTKDQRVPVNVTSKNNAISRPTEKESVAKDGFIESFNGKAFLGDLNEDIYVVRVSISKENLNYIRLRDLEWIVNEKVLGKSSKAFLWLCGIPNRYTCTDKTYSLDPLRVIIPNPNAEMQISKDLFCAGITNSEVKAFESIGGFNNIGNIFLETGYLAEVFKNNSTVNLAFQEILKTIQGALGNTNQFEVHDDGVLGMYIADNNCIFHKASEAELKDRTICTTGLKSTVTSLKTSSAITQDMGSYFATVAQAASTSVADSLPQGPELVYLLGKCKDRHKPNRASEKRDLTKILESAKQHLAHTYIEISGKSDKDSTDQASLESIRKNYAENEENIKSTGAMGFSEDISADFFNASGGTGGELQTGLIPVTTELTMMGIAGFRLYETFVTENGFLPRLYDDWGYIITGIEHKVDKSGWKTSLKTQYYPLVTKQSVSRNV